MDAPATSVAHFLVESGRRATPWSTGGQATLPGPHPRVCCSSGVKNGAMEEHYQDLRRILMESLDRINML